MHAYDLSRLQKPVGPGDVVDPAPMSMSAAPMSMSSAPPAPHEPRREWDEMPRMGALCFLLVI